MQELSIAAANAINRLRSAAAIAKNEAAKRCVGEVVVRFAFHIDDSSVRLRWSRHDGMGTASGVIEATWDEVARADADPLVAALRSAVLSVSRSSS